MIPHSRPTEKRTLAVAALGALAATSASAAIVYSGTVNLTASDTIFFDLAQTGTTPIENASTIPVPNTNFMLMSAPSSAVIITALSPEAGVAGGSYTVPGYAPIPWASNLPFATTVDSTATFTAGQILLDPILGGWPIESGHGYLGLQLGSHYGWAQVSYTSTPSGNSLTLHDFAYEDTANTPIQAGAIPEPSTYAALTGLLAGSAALYARRRKRAA